MNREQEHYALKQELISIPSALDNVFALAQLRVKKRKIVNNCFIKPIGAIAVTFILFVATVNISPNAVHAMENIPGLKQLAEAVSFSRSLTDAVEHDFVQTIGLEQTIDDVTVRVEYVIIDGLRLHVFYSLDSEIHSNLGVSINLRDAENEMNSAGYIGKAQVVFENAKIRHFFGGFYEYLPEIVIWEPNIYNHIYGIYLPGELIGSLTFIIELDAAFVYQNEVISLNYDFVVDGQGLTLTSLYINPAHTRLNFIADNDNTAWLRDLKVYLTNESGKRFEIPATTDEMRNLPGGNAEGLMIATYFVESIFFAQWESLYIVIEEVKWLDKDMEKIYINFTNGTHSALPEGMALDDVQSFDNGWVVTLSTIDLGVHQITYTRNPETWDSLEFRRLQNGWHIHETTPGLFFSVESPPKVENGYIVVALTPQYSRIVSLDMPIKIRVK